MGRNGRAGRSWTGEHGTSTGIGATPSRFRPVAGVAIILLFASLASAGAAEVKVAGLQVVGPGFGKDGREISAFNSYSPGMNVVLVIVTGDSAGAIVEILDDDCSLESMTDDTGKNMLEGVDWGAFPDVSEDGRYGSIEVKSNGRPAAGASKVTLKGTVAYLSAAGSASEKVADVKLEKGTTFSWAGGKATVEAMEASEWSDNVELGLGMSAAQKSQIKEIRFFDGGGKELEVEGTGYMVMGSHATLTFGLPEGLTEATIEVEWWKDLEEVELPFEIEVGLGW